MEIDCPYCGEPLDLLLEEDVEGTLIQDCEVCCNPIELRVRRDGEGVPEVQVARTD
jgi:hypothetical protein